LAASGTAGQPAFTAVNTGTSPVTATITVTPTVSSCPGTPSSYTITVNPSPNVVVPANITVCNSGSVAATSFSSSVAGTTYTWSNSNTAIGIPASGSGNIASFTATNTGTASISATITVTPTSNGCAGTPQSYTITVDPTPTVTVPANIIVCNGSTIAATSFTSTPAGATYTWTNSNTATGLGASGTGNISSFTAVNSGAAAITSTITVTPTVAGCPGTPSSYTITVEPTPAAPTAAGTSVCANMTATLTATAPGGTYQWYDAASGGTLLFTGASYTTPPLTSNTTFYVQTTSAATCVSPMTAVPVSIAAGLVVDAGLNDTICFGASAGLNVTPSGAGYTYNWAPATSLSSATISNPTASPSSTTTYTVSVTDAGGCTGTDQVQIFVDPQLTLAIAGIPATCNGVCDGQTIVIPGGGTTPYTYLWSSGCTNASCNNLCDGTYSITVTDALGCSADSSTTVTEPTAIALTTSSTTANCNQPDGSATVNASGGTGTYSYLWPDGQTTPTATNLIPGSYCVTVTDGNGCTATACVTVPNAAGVSASITAQTPTSCNGVCDGTATAGGTGGVGPYTYVWSTVPAQSSITATGLCAGVYTVTVTDASGCSDDTIVTITEPTLVVTAPIAAQTICSAGSATLTASTSGGNGGPYAYLWSPAGTGASATVVVTPATTTTYTVNATDVNGCAAGPISVTVTVNPPLSVAMTGTTSICPGLSATISANASNGNGGPYNYAWSPAVTGSGNSVSVTPAATTTYTVTVTDGCSPPVIDSVVITVLPLPNIAFNSNVTSGCLPLCVNFNDLTTIAGSTITSWVWDFGDGNNSTTQNPTNCFANAGSYNITLTAISAGGCSSTSVINNMITVHPIPVASFTAPLSASIVNPVIPFEDSSTDAASWFWDFGDVLNPTTNTSTLQNPTHVYSEVGTYCANLTVTSAFGCTDMTQFCIVIDPEYTLYIPNAFSPNGDNINDEFYVKGDHIKDFRMAIYDRWGNMIFFSDDVTRKWDGRANLGSEIAQQDVYVYKIDITDVNNKQHKYIGTVTLVK
jgi:gliding motility-associated-like protein